MPRLIDAEDIKDYWVECEGAKEEFIKENLPDDADYNDYSDFFDKTLQAFKNVIDTSPTIDAEPVVHGHWIHNTDDFTPKKRCSHCGYNKPVVAGENIDQEPDDFCNKCGAKMDEE